MEQREVISLLDHAVEPGNATWADLGSGQGAFTLALRRLAGPAATIYSIDQNEKSLRIQRERFNRTFPHSNIRFVLQDFTADLNVPPLDGILMANALHFVNNQHAFLRRLHAYLKPGGKLLIVEYDTDQANPYVPYPLSFPALTQLLAASGFTRPEMLSAAPSRYWGRMYSAQATKK